MRQIIISIIVIIVGSGLILYRGLFAKSVIKIQNEAFNFNFGHKDIKSSEIAILITGVSTVVIGVLGILNIIEWK